MRATCPESLHESEMVVNGPVDREPDALTIIHLHARCICPIYATNSKHTILCIIFSHFDY